ncbi:MAG: aspartate aminotransferase family protein [Deltaproteobacteria bacterium]|nr:aminotransferase class V-fold PLP-dependent enzyme [Deltaproteobacteria bacterium]RLB45925.1 MAG: aspartate aminotransferase family protein [Deltaproteobacteria bacterium]
MDIKDLANVKLGPLEPLVARIYRYAKRLPIVKERLEAEYAPIMEELRKSSKPYAGEVESYAALPSDGKARTEILAEIRELDRRETGRWKDGYVSGAVYHGDPEHIAFLNEAYAIASQTNPLHSDLWPSIAKYEAEIVSMTANMLGAQRAVDAQVCGAVSSGGTESIMLAMRSYRDWARDTKGITSPELVVPTTAHAAFDKSAQYFGIKLVKVPVGPDCRADVAATKKAINRHTICVVGSAIAFPHGVIDPIEELSELARKRGVGFHTDACLGGFILPWAEKLGYDIPAFDFRLPGVTSMSADTHKYGYAAKGTSVVLYRNYELRHYQYYKVADWPGGLYFSPTFAGSRPGALSAACWAAMISMGESGYLDASRRILETGAKIREGVRAIPELKVLGDPLWVIAFGSDDLDIYRIMDVMTKRGWNLNGLHKPPAVHIAVTLRHTQAEVAERFLDDLRAAVEHTRAHPDEEGGMAPVYGMASTVPIQGVVTDLLERYLDVLYEV